MTINRFHQKVGIEIIILLVFCLLLSLVLAVSIHSFGYIPYWDQAYHLTRASLFENALKNHNVIQLVRLLNGGGQYPQGWSFLVGILFALFGSNPKLGIYINVAFLYISVIAFYYLAKQITGNKILSLLFAMIQPIVPGISRLATDALPEG